MIQRPASMSVGRLVPATPERIFAAFTVPAEIEKWHVPGPDFRVCIAKVDLIVGGKYRIGMQPPDRDEPHSFYGTYREVRPPDRESADDHTRGWTGTLESLATHFAEQGASAS